MTKLLHKAYCYLPYTHEGQCWDLPVKTTVETNKYSLCLYAQGVNGTTLHDFMPSGYCFHCGTKLYYRSIEGEK